MKIEVNVSCKFAHFVILHPLLMLKYRDLIFKFLYGKNISIFVCRKCQTVGSSLDNDQFFPIGAFLEQTLAHFVRNEIVIVAVEEDDWDPAVGDCGKGGIFRKRKVTEKPCAKLH